MLGLLPFLLLQLFVIFCMIYPFQKFFMGSVHTAPVWAKVVSLIGFGGWWLYCALCADWIRNSFNLEFNGMIGFAIIALSLIILASTGKYQEQRLRSKKK